MSFSSKFPLAAGRRSRRLALTTMLALAHVCWAGEEGPPPISIHLSHARDSDDRDRFEVIGLEPSVAQEMADPAALADALSVFVGSLEAPVPIFGEHGTHEGRVVFYPRFALQPGLEYLAVFRHPRRPDKPITESFSIPEAPAGPVAELTAVFPSQDVLPENQLKFYLHFSQPMSRGEAYQRIHLVKEGAGEVEYPFLELGEELWDGEGRRFTLFFDPGRVKRGLRPREEVGPALEENAHYRLVVDREWKDAQGRLLKAAHVKTFQVAEPDYRQPDPERWIFERPAAKSRDPLVVLFDEPLDHGMLERVIGVATGDGAEVEGETSIEGDERRWIFRPALPWRATPHALVVQTNLEDLAGNSIARPFEVDLFREVQDNVLPRVVRLAWEPQ